MNEKINLDEEVENYLRARIRNLGDHPTEASWADEVAMEEICDAIGPERAQLFRKSHKTKTGAEFLMKEGLVPKHLEDHAKLAAALERATYARERLYARAHFTPRTNADIEYLQTKALNQGMLHPEVLELLDQTHKRINLDLETFTSPKPDQRILNSHLSNLLIIHENFIKRHGRITHLKK